MRCNDGLCSAASMKWLESYPLLHVLFQDAFHKYGEFDSHLNLPIGCNSYHSILYACVIALPLRVLKYASVPGIVYLLYRRSFSHRLAELKSLHARLGILLRLWHICVSLLDQGSPDNVNGTGTSGNNDMGIVDQPISRWMLELVPPSLDASFWYSSTWQLSLLKYGMDVLYCSVNQWYTLFGERIIGLPYAATVAMYYACRPSRAAVRASELMGSPDIKVVQFAWRILDNPIMRYVSYLHSSPFRCYSIP
jgi:hypothetical protein